MQKLYSFLFFTRTFLNCKKWLAQIKYATHFSNFHKFCDTLKKPGYTIQYIVHWKMTALWIINWIIGWKNCCPTASYTCSALRVPLHLACLSMYILWSVVNLEGYWIPIQAEFFNSWGPKLRQTIEWVNIIVL